MSFQPRKIINGRMLATLNKSDSVSILLNIEEANGGQLTGRSTDGVSVRVTMTNRHEQVNASGWTEIIGRPNGAGAINADEVIGFENDGESDCKPLKPEAPEEFDAESHNMLVHFLNNKTDQELYVAQ